ncbi:MAG: FlgD immunoglobulin-like domain containing protein [Christensenellales bacterium]
MATNTPLARALSGFSYGDCLLESDDPTLEFSYTVTAETAVQYRVVRQVNGGWDWQNAATFLDDGDTTGGLLTPGRKTRELTLDGILEGESGYMMLQVFAVTGSEVILCSERLLAVRSAAVEPSVTLSAENAEFDASARRELVLEARINVPAEITVCIYDAQGKLVRRLASAQLTRPAPGDVTRLYWDGRNDAGERVPAGAYAAALETVIGGDRQKPPWISRCDEPSRNGSTRHSGSRCAPAPPPCLPGGLRPTSMEQNPIEEARRAFPAAECETPTFSQFPR